MGYSCAALIAAEFLGVEDSLAALGHTIVGPASRVANALRMVETDTCDLALLDINVAGEESYPLAKELKARGIPFVFLSGYGSRGLRGDWIRVRRGRQPRIFTCKRTCTRDRHGAAESANLPRASSSWRTFSSIRSAMPVRGSQDRWLPSPRL